MTNSKYWRIENKGNFTFLTQRVNLIELLSNKKWQPLHFYINPPFSSVSPPFSIKKLVAPKWLTLWKVLLLSLYKGGGVQLWIIKITESISFSYISDWVAYTIKEIIKESFMRDDAFLQMFMYGMDCSQWTILFIITWEI